ncbi:MAG: aminoacyl-tRNA hydrolase [Nitrospirae bacterium]|nr:MAG: aminoacyl-tRNA hydrolase [Nitrospirota bacterium]
MWLVVGLGNPGSRYAKSRHNVGFMVVDEIANRLSFTWRGKKNYLYADGKRGEDYIMLLKPLTYMNRSGEALRALQKNYDIDRLIVVHDDLDLPLGLLRLKKGGSSGGHKGVKSIIDTIGSGDFIRVRLGIGRAAGMNVSDYVLTPFSPDEFVVIKDTINRAADAVFSIIDYGIEKAQNVYNTKRKESGE